jgi:hypothetical protein
MCLHNICIFLNGNMKLINHLLFVETFKEPIIKAKLHSSLISNYLIQFYQLENNWFFIFQSLIIKFLPGNFTPYQIFGLKVQIKNNSNTFLSIKNNLCFLTSFCLLATLNKNCLGSFQVLWNKNCTTEKKIFLT